MTNHYQVSWRGWIDIEADSREEAIEKAKIREADGRKEFNVVQLTPFENDSVDQDRVDELKEKIESGRSGGET